MKHINELLEVLPNHLDEGDIPSFLNYTSDSTSPNIPTLQQELDVKSSEDCSTQNLDIHLSFLTENHEENGEDKSLEDLILIEDNEDFDSSLQNQGGNDSDEPLINLTEEESAAINGCTDAQLKQLMLLNRKEYGRLKQLRTQLFKKWQKVTESIHEERERLLMEECETVQAPADGQGMFGKLATPYFKDRSSFPAPKNPDFYKKLENNEYIVREHHEGSRWISENQSTLTDAVARHYYEKRKQEIKDQVRSIKRKIEKVTKSEEKIELKRQNDKLLKKFDDLLSEVPRKIPPLSYCEIDWHKIATVDMNEKHDAITCKAIWNVYLHPDINKNSFTQEEEEKIMELASYHTLTWDEIAKKLNTNRSPYLVFIHYASKLKGDRYKKNYKFNKQEDDRLKKAVELFRVKDYIPWNKVASKFTDRSKKQLYHRYTYFLQQEDIKKGAFSEEEDVLLKFLVEKFGKDFSKVSKFIPQRTPIQLRSRYSIYLENIQVSLGSFTIEEDKKILEHVEVNGDCYWNKLAKDMNRGGVHVRQRYVGLQKWIAQSPDLPLESFPRRKQMYFTRCQTIRQQRMERCLKKLNKLDIIPTPSTVRLLLSEDDQKFTVRKKVTRRANPQSKKCLKSTIDNDLVDFFISSCRMQRVQEVFSEPEIGSMAQSVLKVLDTLKGDVRLFKTAAADGIENDDPVASKILQILKNEDKSQEEAGIDESVDNFEDGAEDSLTLCLPDAGMKFELPPTATTLIGLRGLLLKFQMYKKENKENSKLKADDTARSERLAREIEQSLANYDEFVREFIENERAVYASRMKSIFAWPSRLSCAFPEKLKDLDVEKKPQIEAQKVAPKRGRPFKKTYEKVAKMVEARKKQREADSAAKKAQDAGNNKRKPGKESKQFQPDHDVLYKPKRLYSKKHKSDDLASHLTNVTTSASEDLPFTNNEKIGNFNEICSTLTKESKNSLPMIESVNEATTSSDIITVTDTHELLSVKPTMILNLDLTEPDTLPFTKFVKKEQSSVNNQKDYLNNKNLIEQVAKKQKVS